MMFTDRTKSCSSMLLSFHIISVFSDSRRYHSDVFFKFITRKCEKGDILIPCGFLIHQAVDGVKIFHEGLFWRCSFVAVSNEYSAWDLWMCKKLCFAVVCVTQLCFQIWHHNCLLPFSKPATVKGLPGRFPLPVSC